MGDYTLNNKVEVKNINSFRAVERAINFEIARQTKLLETGKTWEQETRGWDENKSETVPQRFKENAADYRYFPDPDIPPFHPLQYTSDLALPELPIAKRTRFHEELGFSYSDAEILTQDLILADFAEAVMSELATWLEALPETKRESDSPAKLAKLCGSWLTGKLMGILKTTNKTIADFKISPENFAELIALMHAGRVNTTNALKILIEMVASETDIDPTHIMEEKGYGQVSDEKKLDEVIVEVIKNYPTQVEQYRAGKIAVFQFLKGMIMKATEGSADPIIVEKLLREKLDNDTLDSL